MPNSQKELHVKKYMFLEAACFWPRFLLAQIHFFGRLPSISGNCSVVTDFALNLQICDVFNALRGLNTISKWRQCFGGLEGIALLYIAVKTQVSETLFDVRYCQ